jgi:hypothetical protein
LPGYPLLFQIMAESPTNKFSTKAAIACAVAWLIPGAGHLYLGKLGRAGIFFACILPMFLLGIGLQGEIVSSNWSDFFGFLKFFAEVGSGLLYMASRLAGIGKGEITALTYDYGNVFLYGAGLLNMLVVLDAFDIAVGRKK